MQPSNLRGPRQAVAAARSYRGGGGRRLRILLVSDFFYPNMGGVESHLFQVYKLKA